MSGEVDVFSHPLHEYPILWQTRISLFKKFISVTPSLFETMMSLGV